MVSYYSYEVLFSFFFLFIFFSFFPCFFPSPPTGLGKAKVLFVFETANAAVLQGRSILAGRSRRCKSVICDTSGRGQGGAYAPRCTRGAIDWPTAGSRRFFRALAFEEWRGWAGSRMADRHRARPSGPKSLMRSREAFFLSQVRCVYFWEVGLVFTRLEVLNPCDLFPPLLIILSGNLRVSHDSPGPPKPADANSLVNTIQFSFYFLLLLCATERLNRHEIWL